MKESLGREEMAEDLTRAAAALEQLRQAAASGDAEASSTRGPAMQVIRMAAAEAELYCIQADFNFEGCAARDIGRKILQEAKQLATEPARRPRRLRAPEPAGISGQGHSRRATRRLL